MAEDAIEVVLLPSSNEPVAISKLSKKVKKLKHMLKDDSF
jgi:hypothetical protein